jgi:trans-2,3-dihydro-3-hydroxyanthranilate isomerase
MVDGPETVARLQPDYSALAEIARNQDTGTLTVNVFAGNGGPWKTRMFAPAAGIIEDAATGSAAGPLALHLARHGLVPWGEEITISQGTEIGRPSTLFARADLVENRVGRIEVGGYAIPIGGGWFDATLVRKSLLPSSHA